MMLHWLRYFFFLVLCASRLSFGANCWTTLAPDFSTAELPPAEFMLERLSEILGGQQKSTWYGHRNPYEATEKVQVVVSGHAVQLVGSYAFDWVLAMGPGIGEVVLKPTRRFFFNLNLLSRVTLFAQTMTMLRLRVAQDPSGLFDELKIEALGNGPIRVSIGAGDRLADFYNVFSMRRLSASPD